jgi:predicted DNA binding CopG/RHH family protein
MKNNTLKKKLPIPRFKTEDAERAFWDKADLTDFFSKDDFVPMHFPNLKPTSASISLRMPLYTLMRVKERANALDVPYQSLMKQYIAAGVANAYA